MKNKIFLVLLMTILVTTMVSAQSLTRTVSSTVAPSSTFQVKYTTSGVSGFWFVAWEDTITGCTPNRYANFLTSGEIPSSDNQQNIKTFTAPSSGSCTFTGFYQYSEGIKTYFPIVTVTVGGPCTDTCVSLGYECGYQTVCGVSTNCGTCGAGYLCQNGQCKEERECEVDEDCAEIESCCPVMCINRKCEVALCMTAPPCKNAIWKDYPDCKWDTSLCLEEKNIFTKIWEAISNFFKTIFGWFR